MGKRRRPLLGALSITCAVLVASPSWAAIVEPGYGDLTINQGHGFKPVPSRVNANVGNSVMVAPGGAATVVYEDGCKVDVRPGAVTTIAPLSPCAVRIVCAGPELPARFPRLPGLRATRLGGAGHCRRPRRSWVWHSGL